MQYDVSKKDVHRILATANILNTVNGGMVEPHISVRRNKVEYRVDVSLPGIDSNNVRVEIVEKNLIISHHLEFITGERAMLVPHVIAACPLSLDIDHERIRADYEFGHLKVILPLSDFKSGYRREIDINRN